MKIGNQLLLIAAGLTPIRRAERNVSPAAQKEKFVPSHSP
jgi:hypothetical protein